MTALSAGRQLQRHRADCYRDSDLIFGTRDSDRGFLKNGVLSSKPQAPETRKYHVSEFDARATESAVGTTPGGCKCPPGRRAREATQTVFKQPLGPGPGYTEPVRLRPIVTRPATAAAAAAASLEAQAQPE